MKKDHCRTNIRDIDTKSSGSKSCTSSSNNDLFAPSEIIIPQQINVEMSADMKIEILNRFYSWVFESFIGPLISSSFYVTEAEGKGADVLYYRKGVWNAILKQARTQMGSHFMDIATDQTKEKEDNENKTGSEIFVKGNCSVKGQNTINDKGNILNLKAAPCVRFIPKKSSVRPITNLKSAHRAGLRKKNTR